jgi:hypothetical protein
MIFDKTALARTLNFFHPTLYVSDAFLKNRVVLGNLVAFVADNARLLELYHIVSDLEVFMSGRVFFNYHIAP